MMVGVASSSVLGTQAMIQRKRAAPAGACWCCGIVSADARPDPISRVGPLCRDCWASQPGAYDRASRSSSALRIVLGLAGRLSATREGLVSRLAIQLGVRAHCDVPDAPVNVTRFGHVDPRVLGEAWYLLAESLGGTDG